MKAARVPQIAASISCARREPNSNSGSVPITDLIRAAFVAISVWKFTIFKSAVSINWACASGPSTWIIGSLAKTNSPSFAERIVQANLNSRKYVKNSSGYSPKSRK